MSLPVTLDNSVTKDVYLLISILGLLALMLHPRIRRSILLLL